MKIKHIFLAFVLVFSLWFVGVMALDNQSFNYYVDGDKYYYYELENSDYDLARTHEEMMQNMQKTHPVHYFFFTYQYWIFLAIVLVSIPYEKIYKYAKSRVKFFK